MGWAAAGGENGGEMRCFHPRTGVKLWCPGDNVGASLFASYAGVDLANEAFQKKAINNRHLINYMSSIK